MKKLVFDASSIISLSEKCFINIIGKLAEEKKAGFFMPESVFFETVTHPMKIRRFELNAFRIQSAINNNWFTAVKPGTETARTLQATMKIAQNLCYADGQPIQIMHRGELEALALLKEMNADALVIDERTTRMLLEEPQNLRSLLEFRHRKKIRFDEKKLLEFRRLFGGTRIFRSSEMLALAYEQNCFGKELEHSRASLKAALFSVKYAGCAITHSEINEYLKGVAK
ncbi:MAG: hypothetical protein HY392_00845 [Candidatus Diapherotrites archaeon]|nr:hypothetical protein [Candidatus Diapherotrites archaeon]